MGNLLFRTVIWQSSKSQNSFMSLIRWLSHSLAGELHFTILTLKHFNIPLADKVVTLAQSSVEGGKKVSIRSNLAITCDNSAFQTHLALQVFHTYNFPVP